MSSVKLEITEGQIQNAIAVALAESFTDEKRDALLRDIIRAHLNTKKDNYSRETLLSETVNKFVREVVAVELAKHIEGMRPEIEAIIAKFFGEGVKPQIQEKLEEALSRAITKDLQVSIGFPSSY